MTQEQDTQPSFDFDAVFEVDDYLYFYSDALTDERTEAEVAAIQAYLELDRQATILDLACGFGRHANRLAALGHQVTAIDRSVGFLEIARQDADRRGVQVDYQQVDMREIQFSNVFDRILLAFTAFGYFEDNENLLVLKKIQRALKPGGLLLFDTLNRDVFLRFFLPYIVTEKDGNLMIDRNTFDTASGRSYNRRITIRDGIRKDKPFFVRLYNPSEIQELLQKAGLEMDKLYGGWENQPASIDSRRMVIIARKPE